jgi:thioredoxin reductase (NADPH)
MITSAELEKIPLFAGVEEQERQRLARRAADIHLEPGEWLVREGEEPRFFIVLAGELEVVKDIIGQRRALGRSVAGEFSGETPIFMGTANIVSVRAVTKCRVARFERQQLQELVRDSPSAGEIIFSTMSSRLAMAQDLARDTPSSRVDISGSKYDTNCRAIRAFLSANRIQYDWRPSITDSESGIAVSVEGTLLESPTVRRVAEALGFQTVPKHQHYDIIIAGAGPAGMAAAVYSASEGLKVLLVERFAAGGQAGTSARIENYLGFPAGISGDELTERALKQVKHFGVEMLVKRNIEEVQPLDDGHCVTLDGGDRITATVLLLTTGVSWHRLEFEGHDDLLGRGILMAPLALTVLRSRANVSSSSAVATRLDRPPSFIPATLPRSSCWSEAPGLHKPCRSILSSRSMTRPTFTSSLIPRSQASMAKTTSSRLRPRRTHRMVRNQAAPATPRPSSS